MWVSWEGVGFSCPWHSPPVSWCFLGALMRLPLPEEGADAKGGPVGTRVQREARAVEVGRDLQRTEEYCGIQASGLHRVKSNFILQLYFIKMC